MNARGQWAASADAVAHALVDGPLTDDLALEGPEGHHLQRVRRVRPGDTLTVGDGRGTWRTYLVATARRGGLTLTASAAERQEPSLVPTLTVAFVVAKGDQPERVVAALTELGVDVIVPCTSRRSVVTWSGDRATAARERLARVARAAALQARRARLPVLEAPRALPTLAGRSGLVVADRDGPPAASLAPPGAEGWTLVVGPEGGLEPEEVAGLAPVALLGLGPHVLRSATAAIGGAAALSGRRAPADCHGA